MAVRPLGVLLAATLLGVLSVTATEPLELPPGEYEPVQLPESPAARHRIAQALSGESDGDEIGDPVLGDIVDLIESQGGSILRGSALDPAADSLPLANASEPVSAHADPSRGSTARRARAAEQLLKAARLLQQLESGNSVRARLVTEMRVEAAKLLGE